MAEINRRDFVWTSAGGVAALQGLRTPSLVARAVKEQTDHHLLEKGPENRPIDALLSGSAAN